MLRAIALAKIALCLVTGCGPKREPAPTVHPATGKLLSKYGQPVTEGSIEFVSTGDPPKSARSPLGADGTFTLAVMTADGTLLSSTVDRDILDALRRGDLATDGPVTLRTASGDWRVHSRAETVGGNPLRLVVVS